MKKRTTVIVIAAVVVAAVAATISLSALTTSAPAPGTSPAA